MPKASLRGRRPVGQPAVERFVALSNILTGEKVAQRSAMRHLATLCAILGADAVQAVLRRFQELEGSGDLTRRVAEELVTDAELGPTVKAMILLWFTGVLLGPNGVAAAVTQEDYFDALMWDAVGAHAPALSNGYFGHWRYPPDEGT